MRVGQRKLRPEVSVASEEYKKQFQTSKENIGRQDGEIFQATFPPRNIVTGERKRECTMAEILVRQRLAPKQKTSNPKHKTSNAKQKTMNAKQKTSNAKQKREIAKPKIDTAADI